MNTTIHATVIRETAKAFLADVVIDTHAGRSSTTMWLPKSQVKVGSGLIELPTWLLDAKIREINTPGFICVIADDGGLAEAEAARAARRAQSAAIKAHVDAEQQAMLRAVYEEGQRQRAAARA